MTAPDKHTTGKWLIGVHKHLEEFSASPELTYFDATTRAAQCGRFLALIRKKEIIKSEAELVAIARSIRIPPTDLKRIILPELHVLIAQSEALSKKTSIFDNFLIPNST